MNLVVADVDHEHDDLFVILIMAGKIYQQSISDRRSGPTTVKVSKGYLVHILARYYVQVAKCQAHCLDHYILARGKKKTQDFNPKR